MENSDLFIDVSKLPSEWKEILIPLSEKHNALVDKHIALTNEVDKITGETEEEKEGMFLLFNKIRPLGNWLHSRRFDLTLFLIQGFMVVGLLKFFGVDGETINQLVQVIVGLLGRI